MFSRWKLILLVIMVGVFIFVKAPIDAETWQEPTSGCSPASDPSSCNISAPLNTSIDNQTKDGSLSIGGDLSTSGNLTVTGNASASLLTASTYVYTPKVTGNGVLILNSTSGIVNFGSGSGATIRSVGSFTAKENVTAEKNLTVQGRLTAQGSLIIPNVTSPLATALNGSIINDSGTFKIYDSGTWKTMLLEPEVWVNEAGGDTITLAAASTAVNALAINNLKSGATGLDITQTLGSNPGISVTNTSTDVNALGVKIDNSKGIGLDVDTQGTLAVHACNDGNNCVDLGTNQNAGEFHGYVTSDNLITADGFLATNMKYSSQNSFSRNVVYQTDRIGFARSSVLRYHSINAMVWDGSYMYLAGNELGSDYRILKTRGGAEPEYIHDYEPTALISFIPEDGVVIADYIVSVDSGNYYPGNCTVGIVDKEDFTDNTVFLTGQLGCYHIISDGQYAIVPVENTKKIYFINPNSSAIPGSIDISTNCSVPKDVVFDGNDLWITCENPGAGKIIRLDYSCTTSTTVSCSGTQTVYDDLVGPNLIFFDGNYLWVTYNNPSVGAKTLRKLDFNNIGHSTSLQEKLFYTSSDVGVNTLDIEFDGSNIWLANGATEELNIVPAAGGVVSKIKSFNDTTGTPGTTSDKPKRLAFDGTNIWMTYIDADYRTTGEYGLKMFSTGNGSFGNDSQRHFRGIIMSTDDNQKTVCLYIDFDPFATTPPKYRTAIAINDPADPTYTNYKNYCGY
ncbi:MAG: hypothetical protein V1898_03730 [Patescibacteria group bacterium]